MSVERLSVSVDLLLLSILLSFHVYVCTCVHLCVCAGEERSYLGKDRCQITMVLQVDPRVRQAAAGPPQGFVRVQQEAPRFCVSVQPKAAQHSQ